MVLNSGNCLRKRNQQIIRSFEKTLFFFFFFRRECSGQVLDKPQLTFKSVAILKTALENCEVRVFQIQMRKLVFSVT